MLIGILFTIIIIVGLALTGVVLLQRSEGGALGMGGGTTSFMTARGAGDLLTRLTWILGGTFFALCMGLTILAGRTGATSSVVDRLKIENVDPNSLAPAAPAAPTPSGAPAPIQAPTPSISNLPSLPQSAPAPAAPATAPAPAAQ